MLIDEKMRDFYSHQGDKPQVLQKTSQQNRGNCNIEMWIIIEIRRIGELLIHKWNLEVLTEKLKTTF